MGTCTATELARLPAGGSQAIGEHSRFRRWTLYLFARHIEMPLLYWGYHLLRGRYRRLGQNRLVRAILGWSVAVPFGYLGDTARPAPYPQILQMIDALDGPIGVGPCRCRTAHQSCDHPLDTDIVIRTDVDAWTRAFPRDYRLVGKEEVKRIVAECHDQGMWHMVFVHCPVTDENKQENEYVICNCCACGCVPYILNRQLGQRMYPRRRDSSVPPLWVTPEEIDLLDGYLGPPAQVTEPQPVIIEENCV